LLPAAWRQRRPVVRDTLNGPAGFVIEEEAIAFFGYVPRGLSVTHENNERRPSGTTSGIVDSELLSPWTSCAATLSILLAGGDTRRPTRDQPFRFHSVDSDSTGLSVLKCGHRRSVGACARVPASTGRSAIKLTISTARNT
jgi:hypothetical protein